MTEKEQDKLIEKIVVRSVGRQLRWYDCQKFAQVLFHSGLSDRQTRAWILAASEALKKVESVPETRKTENEK